MSTSKTTTKNLLRESDVDPKNIKARITTYIDLDVVKALKKEARRKRVGYQTLLNQKLRETVFKTVDLEKRLLKVEKKLKIVK